MRLATYPSSAMKVALRPSASGRRVQGRGCAPGSAEVCRFVDLGAAKRAFLVVGLTGSAGE